MSENILQVMDARCWNKCPTLMRLAKKATPKTLSSSFESQYLKNKTNNKKQKEMLPTVSSVNNVSIAQ